MKRDRRAILSLVALGRITPYQAERLLMACNAGGEGLWVIACILGGLLAWAVTQGSWPGLLHSAHAWFSGAAWHRSLALIAQWRGDLQ